MQLHSGKENHTSWLAIKEQHVHNFTPPVRSRRGQRSEESHSKQMQNHRCRVRTHKSEWDHTSGNTSGQVTESAATQRYNSRRPTADTPAAYSALMMPLLSKIAHASAFFLGTFPPSICKGGKVCDQRVGESYRSTSLQRMGTLNTACTPESTYNTTRTHLAPLPCSDVDEPVIKLLQLLRGLARCTEQHLLVCSLQATRCVAASLSVCKNMLETFSALGVVWHTAHSMQRSIQKGTQFTATHRGVRPRNVALIPGPQHCLGIL